MTVAEIGLVIVPVFALVGLGLGAARIGLLGDEVGEGLGAFVFTIGVPVLIFRTMATASFPDISPWPLWFAYFGGVAVSWCLGALAATRLFGRSRAEGVIAGVSASFSNLALVGIPLVVTAFGEAGAVPLFMILSIHLPIMMVAGTMLTERAVRLDGGGPAPRRPDALLSRLLINILANPLIVALGIGAAWRMLGLGLEGIPRTIVDHLAAAAIPCALISLGMALKRHGLTGETAIAGLLGGLKLAVMPLIVFLLARFVFDLPPLWIAVATVSAACPSGVNAYLFANRFDVARATASNAIGISTVAAAVTLWIWFDVVAYRAP